MPKMNRSFFSDSSSDNESITQSKRTSSQAIRKNADIDFSNVQKLDSIEEGEKCLELLVEVISINQKSLGQNKATISALVSDGKNFAMLETTSEEATRKLLCVVKMSDFNTRTFLLRRVAAVPISPKNNLGNMEFAIAYNSQSLAEEIFDKKHLIKDSFHNYMPYLKIFLPDEAKVRRTKTLEPPPKPTVVTFAAKVLGVTHEVKSLRDSNGAYTHDVVLTKVHITVNDEDLEIAAWAHTGMFLAHVLNDYIYQTVGFAFIEASSWVGKTITKINLSFGVESKLKLPDVKSVVPQIKHSAMKNTPKFLMEIGSFEGKAQLDIDLQLVKNCELIDEHYFTLAADKNRHKAQVYFCFDPQKVTKGTSIHVKAATITHTGRVMNISVDSMENIEVLPHPIFTELVIGELSWPIANVKVEKNEQEKDGIEAAAGENEETYATIKEPIDAVGTTTRKATRKGK